MRKWAGRRERGGRKGVGNDGSRGSEREGKGGVGGVRWRRVKGSGGDWRVRGPTVPDMCTRMWAFVSSFKEKMCG